MLLFVDVVISSEAKDPVSRKGKNKEDFLSFNKSKKPSL